MEKHRSALYPALGAIAFTAVAAAWLTGQAHRLGDLRAREAELRRQAALASSHHQSRLSRSPQQDKDPLPLEDGHIDWVRLAGIYRNDSSALQPEIEKRLLDLSPDELLAEYRRLLAAPMNDGARDGLALAIARVLAGKDPQLALNTFRERISANEDKWATVLSAAVRGLAEKEPQQATAWIDSLIAEGRLECRRLEPEGARTMLEAALIRSVMQNDPALAARRLRELPPGQRATVFLQDTLLKLSPEQIPAVAELWRQTLSPQQQGHLFTNALRCAYDRTDAGLSGMTAWLQAAAPEARRDLVAGSFTDIIQIAYDDPEEIFRDVYRLNDWARSEMPADAETVTAAAVRKLARFSTLEIASNSIEELEGGSAYRDRLWVALLTSREAEDQSEEVLKLASRITDPELRQSVIAQHTPEE